MKRSPLPTIGTTGPRRPIPPRTPSATLTRISAALLQVAPTDIFERQRLEVVFFDAPPPILPCGQPRPQTIACVCAFRLGGDFLGRARVERGLDGPCLAVETQAWDSLLDRAVCMDYGLGLMRGLYREMGRLYASHQARCYVRGAGRN